MHKLLARFLAVAIATALCRVGEAQVFHYLYTTQANPVVEGPDAIIATSDGGYAMLSNRYHISDLTANAAILPANPNLVTSLIKVSNTGLISWVRDLGSVGASGADKYWDLQEATADLGRGLIIVGEGIYAPSVVNTGGYHFILRLDPNGNTIWKWGAGSPNGWFSEHSTAVLNHPGWPGFFLVGGVSCAREPGSPDPNNQCCLPSVALWADQNALNAAPQLIWEEHLNNLATALPTYYCVSPQVRLAASYNANGDFALIGNVMSILDQATQIVTPITPMPYVVRIAVPGNGVPVKHSVDPSSHHIIDAHLFARGGNESITFDDVAGGGSPGKPVSIVGSVYGGLWTRGLVGAIKGSAGNPNDQNDDSFYATSYWAEGSTASWAGTLFKRVWPQGNGANMIGGTIWDACPQGVCSRHALATLLTGNVFRPSVSYGTCNGSAPAIDLASFAPATNGWVVAYKATLSVGPETEMLGVVRTDASLRTNPNFPCEELEALTCAAGSLSLQPPLWFDASPRFSIGLPLMGSQAASNPAQSCGAIMSCAPIG
jgi:hypothetical protein